MSISAQGMRAFEQRDLYNVEAAEALQDQTMH